MSNPGLLPDEEGYRVPDWVTLRDVAGIIRSAGEGAESNGGRIECSAAALNSWAEVIERNLEEPK